MEGVHLKVKPSSTLTFTCSLSHNTHKIYVHTHKNYTALEIHFNGASLKQNNGVDTCNIMPLQ